MEWGEKSLQFFFRDTNCPTRSDLLYQLGATDAVQDMMKRTAGIRTGFGKKTAANRDAMWCRYPGWGKLLGILPEDGVPFLRQLYQALSDDPTLGKRFWPASI